MKSTMLKTMKAAAIDRFGGIDAIKLETLAVPEIDDDEVLIHVEIAGVGVWDPYEREGYFDQMFGGGTSFPHVLGSEGAGTIEDVGEKVTNFKEGDRVYGVSLMNPKGGFYAQYAAVKSGLVSHIPGDLTIEQAGAMPVDAITGLQGLELAGVKPGDSVMIFGASGGIGHMAIQLAKRMGARVFAVASGKDGVELARQLNADGAVDGHRDDILEAARRFAPDGVDAALVTAGGEMTDRALEAVRYNGRVAYPNGVSPEPQVRSDITMEAYDGELNQDSIQKLNRVVESEPFHVHVAQVFPLEEAARAHEALDHHFLGKIALRTE